MFDRRTLLLSMTGALLWRYDVRAETMTIRPIEPMPLSYAQAVEVAGASRLLFVSGQVPADRNGVVPASFDDQARLVWANVRDRLEQAGMSFDNLVKVTIFLSDRAHRAGNSAVRHEVHGARTPAITVIITGIYSEEWLLEIEAVAAA
jgi:2-iminobutanoate/2-iminopropanoate deaminase